MCKECKDCKYSEPVYFKDEANGQFYAFQGIMFCNKKDDFVKGGQCDV